VLAHLAGDQERGILERLLEKALIQMHSERIDRAQEERRKGHLAYPPCEGKAAILQAAICRNLMIVVQNPPRVFSNHLPEGRGEVFFLGVSLCGGEARSARPSGEVADQGVRYEGRGPALTKRSRQRRTLCRSAFLSVAGWKLGAQPRRRACRVALRTSGPIVQR